MSEAMKSIVGSYVRLGDVNALIRMKAHRAKLLTNFKLSGIDAVDCYSVSKELENEIAIIDDGLATLDSRPVGQVNGQEPPVA
jgi:hypothetical protein